MSRIGRQPVIVPSDVTVAERDGRLAVSRGETELVVPLLPGVSYAQKEGSVVFELKSTARAGLLNRQARKNWGTMRNLFANAVTGLMRGFEKSLILEGIGYRMTLKDNTLTMALGFSHPVYFTAPSGIAFQLEGNTLRIRGAEKQVVGQVAAEIRDLRKVEPYKGKGFRYSDEVVRRKAGKKTASGAG